MGRLLNDQEYDDVEIRVANGERGFFIELWATEPELYTVGFGLPDRRGDSKASYRSRSRDYRSLYSGTNSHYRQLPDHGDWFRKPVRPDAL